MRTGKQETFVGYGRKTIYAKKEKEPPDNERLSLPTSNACLELRVGRGWVPDRNRFLVIFAVWFNDVVRAACQAQGHYGQQIFKRFHFFLCFELDMAVPDG